MRMILLTLFIIVLFSSCFTYKIFPKEYRSFTYSGEREKAIVLNPQLTKEFKILKDAGIFQLAGDSSDESVIKIKLYQLKPSFVCGEPVLGSLITLGQVPVLLPDRYQYQFDEIQGTDTLHRQFELHISTRYWFWDMFAFKKKFKEKAGQTLLANYYDKRKPDAVAENR